MNSREIVDLLLEADQPSAGDTSGVYVFGPNLPPQGYCTPSVESAIKEFRRSGIINPQTQDGAGMLDQLVNLGYTFLLKKSPQEVEVIGPVPVKTSPEGAEQATQYLGLDRKQLVAHRRTATATPTSLDVNAVLSKEGYREREAQATQKQNVYNDDMRPLNAPIKIGLTFDQESKEGVHVLEVHPARPAAQAGLQAGDVIVQAGKFTRHDNQESRPYKIQTPRHLEYVLRVADPKFAVPFRVIRGDGQYWLPILATSHQQAQPSSSAQPQAQPQAQPPAKAQSQVKQMIEPNQPTPARETGHPAPNVSSLT